MMKLTLCSAFLVTAVSVPVAPDGKYDVKIENAVKGVIARKINGLRGGFGFRQEPSMTRLRPAEKKFQAPVTGSWQIVTSRESVDVSTFGSIQTFSDGSAPTADQRRAMARKKVSWVINF